MFKLFNRQTQNTVKDFYAEIGTDTEHELTRLAAQHISLHRIVGSVGRAAELDEHFRSKGRGWSDRHQSIQNMMQAGQPLPPIQVFKFQRGTQPEYYVVDGHHRVAVALKLGFESLHAEITEVTLNG